MDHQEQYQKNLTNRFREKFKNIDLGPQNGTFTPFWANQEFFSKKGSAAF